nr:reverse transcriptase domain-containing protein [Tanacetum cinerariifolium]
LEEDPEEEPKKEEENEAMVNDEEDDAEIADADDVPIPLVIQFGSNFHVGESSASRDLLEGNSEVCAPGPMCCDLKSVHRGVKRVRMEETRAGGPAGGPAAAPVARECSFIRFMKCDPTQFHGTEGVVRLVRWFKKMENTFNISECAEGKKVKFTTSTLYGRALTWWNSQVATLGREVANERPWTEVKQMMTDEFCPTEEKKVELYIKRLPEIIKGETTSSKPATLNEAVCMAHALMESKIQAKNERVTEGIKRKWENNNQGNNNNNNSYNRGATVQSNVICYERRERGHKSRACPKKADRRGGNVQGQAYVIRDAEHNQGLNVVTGMDLLVERDALIVCGKKEVHVPYKNKTLVVKSDSIVSRLKVISCIKARKYIERGSQLFIAQVTEKEPAKKQQQDMPVICNFHEVFLYDLPGLPPPRQVEFKIKLIPDVAPIARTPYHLASSELKELTEGAVEVVRWFEKMENTFEITECAKGRKVKFATATLHGRALTWWISQVATLGRKVANGRPWSEVKQMMTDEFCPTKEVHRLEDELRHLKLRDMNIAV